MLAHVERYRCACCLRAPTTAEKNAQRTGVDLVHELAQRLQRLPARAAAVVVVLATGQGPLPANVAPIGGSCEAGQGPEGTSTMQNNERSL